MENPVCMMKNPLSHPGRSGCQVENALHPTEDENSDIEQAREPEENFGELDEKALFHTETFKNRV